MDSTSPTSTPDDNTSEVEIVHLTGKTDLAVDTESSKIMVFPRNSVSSDADNEMYYSLESDNGNAASSENDEYKDLNEDVFIPASATQCESLEDNTILPATAERGETDGEGHRQLEEQLHEDNIFSGNSSAVESLPRELEELPMKPSTSMMRFAISGAPPSEDRPSRQIHEQFVRFLESIIDPAAFDEDSGALDDKKLGAGEPIPIEEYLPDPDALDFSEWAKVDFEVTPQQEDNRISSEPDEGDLAGPKTLLRLVDCNTQISTSKGNEEDATAQLPQGILKGYCEHVSPSPLPSVESETEPNGNLIAPARFFEVTSVAGAFGGICTAHELNHSEVFIEEAKTEKTLPPNDENQEVSDSSGEQLRDIDLTERFSPAEAFQHEANIPDALKDGAIVTYKRTAKKVSFSNEKVQRNPLHNQPSIFPMELHKWPQDMVGGPEVLEDDAEGNIDEISPYAETGVSDADFTVNLDGGIDNPTFVDDNDKINKLSVGDSQEGDRSNKSSTMRSLIKETYLPRLKPNDRLLLLYPNLQHSEETNDEKQENGEGMQEHVAIHLYNNEGIGSPDLRAMKRTEVKWWKNEYIAGSFILFVVILVIIFCVVLRTYFPMHYQGEPRH